MAIIVFSRRGIHVKQGKDEITAIYVPSVDQTLVYRDGNMTTADVAQRMGKVGLTPLWREELGQTICYGILPDELQQVRQAVKVWLASDFAPTESEAFFFMFEKRWLVHGVRETTDEGERRWRSTVIEHQPEEIFQMLTDSVADLMLSTNATVITVSVDGNPAEYVQLQGMLAPLQITLVPFSSLKPSLRARVLYRHRDYTLIMFISLFFGFLVLAGAGVWWALNAMTLHHLQSQIADVRRQVSAIQISDNLGSISDPDGMLKQMKKPFTQQPSAILDAAARFGAAFGSLTSVDFHLTNVAPGSASANNAAQESAGIVVHPEQRLVNVSVDHVHQSLLINQERLAKQLLPQLPWINDVASIGAAGDEAHLSVLVQIDSPPGVKLPSATTVPDLTNVSLLDVATEEDSSSLVSTNPAAALVSPTGSAVSPVAASSTVPAGTVEVSPAMAVRRPPPADMPRTFMAVSPTATPPAGQPKGPAR